MHSPQRHGNRERLKRKHEPEKVLPMCGGVSPSLSRFNEFLSSNIVCFFVQIAKNNKIVENNSVYFILEANEFRESIFSISKNMQMYNRRLTTNEYYWKNNMLMLQYFSPFKVSFSCSHLILCFLIFYKSKNSFEVIISYLRTATINVSL